MPKKYQEMFDPEAIDLPDNFASEHCFDFGIRAMRDEVLAPYPRTEKDVRRHIAEYFAMIAHLDDGIGRILKKLEDKGIKDNTIVVFAGDNGLALGQHGLFGKQNAYEHSIRVPLVFSGPGIPRNQRRDETCYLFDIFATLADMLGLKVPGSVEGRSLKKAIEDQSKGVDREYLYFAYEDKLRAVKKDGFKLIEYAGDNFRQTQLFDLTADPAETHNLAESRHEKVEELRTEMIRLRDDWDDRTHPTGRRFWGFFGDG